MAYRSVRTSSAAPAAMNSSARPSDARNDGIWGLVAFSGPWELRRRIGTLDPARITAMDPAALEDAFKTRPALHRFPANMAHRTQDLCAAIVRDYGGDAGRVWREAVSGKDLEASLLALPGIGEMKAKTLIAIIGKRLGVKPPGWEEVAPKHPTLGDVDSPPALAAD